MRKDFFAALCGALLVLVATLAQQFDRSSPDPAITRARQLLQAPAQQVQVQQEEELASDPERAAQERLAEELVRERLAEIAQSATPWPGFQRCYVTSASCLDLDERPFVPCKTGGAEACDRSGTFMPLASK